MVVRKLAVPVAVAVVASFAIDATADDRVAERLSAAQAREAALEKDPAKLRFRHHSEWLIQRWKRAAKGAAGAQLRMALEGELRAWRRLAHWSGHAGDAASARALTARLAKLEAPVPVAASAPAKAATEVAPPPVPSPAPVAPVTDLLPNLTIEVEGEGFVVVLPVAHAITAAKHEIPPRDGVGSRIYFDISPLRAARPALETRIVEHAGIERIRVGQFDADTVRLVFDVAAGHAAPARMALVQGSPARLVVGVSEAAALIAEVDAVVEAVAGEDADVGTSDELAAIVAELRREHAEHDVGEGEADEIPPLPEDGSSFPRVVPSVEETPPPPKNLKRSTVDAMRPRRGALVKIRRVVIDAGHGGKDTGAPGPKRVKEKDVNLAIAKRLGRVLTKELGVKVVYTRTTDVYVSLKRRVEIANKAGADLFISIHANAHENRRIRGIETYYLNTTTNRYSKRLANRENSPRASAQVIRGDAPAVGDTDEASAVPDGPMAADLQLLLADLAMKSATDESRRLAGYIQSSVVGTMRRDYEDVRDLGVKKALFYVLLGVRMPSVLVETGFMTHAAEGRRLSDPKYQARISAAIANGVRRFVRERDAIARKL